MYCELTDERKNDEGHQNCNATKYKNSKQVDSAFNFVT